MLDDILNSDIFETKNNDILQIKNKNYDFDQIFLLILWKYLAIKILDMKII